MGDFCLGICLNFSRLGINVIYRLQLLSVFSRIFPEPVCIGKPARNVGNIALNVQECDARGDDSSNADWPIIIQFKNRPFVRKCI